MAKKRITMMLVRTHSTTIRSALEVLVVEKMFRPCLYYRLARKDKIQIEFVQKDNTSEVTYIYLMLMSTFEKANENLMNSRGKVEISILIA